MQAQSQLPDGPNYRADVFRAGLMNAGYTIKRRIDHPQPDDILLLWNRRQGDEPEAKRFEKAGARVVVTENGYLGKNWQGKKWFALAIGHHAGAGDWPQGDGSRWAEHGVEFAPWREGGSETIILAQRGIGEPGIASPRGWAQNIQARFGGRIRPHPGVNEPSVPLEVDLRDAKRVMTWHSAAAIHALLLGIPVYYDFPAWLMAHAAWPIDTPHVNPPERLRAFEIMMWAMWHAEEIRTGEAFVRLLHEPH